jgi:hypothetical protein
VLLHVLDGDQAPQFAGVVYDRQFLYAVLSNFSLALA